MKHIWEPVGSVQKRMHRTYTEPQIRPQIEKVLAALRPEKLQWGLMIAIHQDTEIPQGTLADWHKRLQTRPNWAPWKADVKGRQTLSPAIEANIKAYIKDNYIDTGRPCTSNVVKNLARDAFAAADSTSIGRERFAASNKWEQGFLKRANLSLRTPSVDRRGVISEEYAAYFLMRVEAAFGRLPPEFIYNMDETCWRFINAPRLVIGEKGSAAVKLCTKKSPKKSFTAIGTITAAGDRLPLWILTKGKTNACLGKFGDQGETELHYSESGWSTEKIIVDYLNWLAKRTIGPCALIMDIFRAHITPWVRETAKRLDIDLIIVPANGTSKYQPLDFKIFGTLKQFARQEFDRLTRLHTFEETDKVAAEILLSCWNRLTKEQIKNAWQCIIPRMRDGA